MYMPLNDCDDLVHLNDRRKQRLQYLRYKSNAKLIRGYLFQVRKHRWTLAVKYIFMDRSRSKAEKDFLRSEFLKDPEAAIVYKEFEKGMSVIEKADQRMLNDLVGDFLSGEQIRKFLEAGPDEEIDEVTEFLEIMGCTKQEFKEACLCGMSYGKFMEKKRGLKE